MPHNNLIVCSFINHHLMLYSPLSRKPLLSPALPYRAGQSGCRQNQWSMNTAPVSATTYYNVLSQWHLSLTFIHIHLIFLDLYTVSYHFRVWAIVEFHGFLLHISNGSVCTQGQGDEENTCMTHKHTHAHMLCYSRDEFRWVIKLQTTLCNISQLLDLRDFTCDVEVGGHFAVS